MIAGLGALAALAPEGTVIATFTKATYLRFPSGVLALTDVPGALHICGADRSGLEKGDRFTTPPSWRPGLVAWQGALPAASAVDAEQVWAVARHSALLKGPYLPTWRAASETGDLTAACRLLGGLGPGLTPSGDDALAGMLLAARLQRPGDEDDLVRLADTVATHEISLAFLRWAARGQSVEPVHRLLLGDPRAGAELLALGHTSGADLALGLTTLWPRSHGSTLSGG